MDKVKNQILDKMVAKVHHKTLHVTPANVAMKCIILSIQGSNLTQPGPEWIRLVTKSCTGIVAGPPLVSSAAQCIVNEWKTILNPKIVGHLRIGIVTTNPDLSILASQLNIDIMVTRHLGLPTTWIDYDVVFINSNTWFNISWIDAFESGVESIYLGILCSDPSWSNIHSKRVFQPIRELENFRVVQSCAATSENSILISCLYRPGYTRRDLVRELDVERVILSGCMGTTMLEDYMKDLVYKCGKSPKYGA